MKPARILIVVFCLFAGSLAAAPGLFSEDVLERILAVVNDEIITEQDLQMVMVPVAAQYRTMYSQAEFESKIKEARQEFLGKLIEDKLILSEAKRLQVIVKDAEVDEMMAEVRNKFPNREIFLKAIQDQGLTEKKLWNRFHDQLMTQKLVSYEVKSKVSVSPGQISEYYKANPQEFTQGDRVELKHILIRVGPRSEGEARAFAESLVAQIRSGKSFEDMAKSYSEGAEAKEGGQMGWVEKGQLLGEIDQKVFTAAEGEITPPIQSSLGFHIFKVVKKERFQIRPLPEVRDQIGDILFKKDLKARLEKWVNNLKKNAYISIR